MTDPLRADAAYPGADADALLGAALAAAGAVTDGLPHSQRCRVRDGIALTWLWAAIRLPAQPTGLPRAEIAAAMQRPLTEGGLGLARGTAYERVRAMVESGAWPEIAGRCLVGLPSATDPVRYAGQDPSRAIHGDAYGDGDAMDDEVARAPLCMHGVSGVPDTAQGAAPVGQSLPEILRRIDDAPPGAEQQAIRHLADWLISELAQMGERGTDWRVAVGWAADVVQGGPPKQRILADALAKVRDAHGAGTIKKTPGAMLLYLLRQGGIHHARAPPPRPQ